MKSNFRVSDFVTFHTQYGQTTGIIEDISVGYKGKHQIAEITVRTMFGKPKKYHRPLYKLKPAELVKEK